MTESPQEPTTVGLSEAGHRNLKRLVEYGHFGQMLDAYKFGIALALAHGEIASPASTGTIFNVGSFDPDRSIYEAILALRDPVREPVYKTAERLAEWGVEELFRREEAGTLSFSEIKDEIGDKQG